MTLTTSAAATVTARAGAAEAATVEVTVGAVPTIEIQLPQQPTPTVGVPVTFDITVTVAAEGGSPVESLEIDFGDGDSADLGPASGQTSAMHIYEEDGSYTVRVTVTDRANQTTSQAIVISVLPAPVAP